MIIALTQDGYEKLMQRLELLQESVDQGLFAGSRAEEVLRGLRPQVFSLRQLIKEICCLNPAAPDTDSPDAA